jgi:hypothetical protein
MNPEQYSGLTFGPDNKGLQVPDTMAEYDQMMREREDFAQFCEMLSPLAMQEPAKFMKYR